MLISKNVVPRCKQKQGSGQGSPCKPPTSALPILLRTKNGFMHLTQYLHLLATQITPHKDSKLSCKTGHIFIIACFKPKKTHIISAFHTCTQDFEEYTEYYIPQRLKLWNIK